MSQKEQAERHGTTGSGPVLAGGWFTVYRNPGRFDSRRPETNRSSIHPLSLLR